MMKYGLRIENPGINVIPSAGCPILVAFFATGWEIVPLLRVLFLVLHHGHRLRMNLLTRFQPATIADYDLLSFA